jgi:hypothetical protein
MPSLDYQVVIDAVGAVITNALPIGIAFAFAEKIVNSFLSMAFGERKIRL